MKDYYLTYLPIAINSQYYAYYVNLKLHIYIENKIIY